MLFPLHSEVVPFLGVRVGEEDRSRALGSGLAIPRVDDPGAGEDGAPRRHRHRDHADPEAAGAVTDTCGAEELWAQAVQAFESTGEAQEEHRPKDHAVNESPELAVG